MSLSEEDIIANRHIHMSPEDGEEFGLHDDDLVTVDTVSERRTGFFDVQVRIHKDFRLEMHLDTDDANEPGLKNGSKAAIVK